MLVFSKVINIVIEMKRYYIGLFLLFSVASIHATEIGERDSIGFNVLFNRSMFQSNSPDSLIREKHKKTFFHRVGDVFTKFFREFNVTDSSYIEPQHYNYTVMLQNTNTYEEYTLSSKEGQRISFAPDPTFRLGPYLGWRWMFLGYTLDLKHINASSQHTNKKEFDLSLYSSMLGIDLFWRQTGNDYHVQRMNLSSELDTSPMHKVPFDGFKSSIKGFNLYYIFNHRKFSYPAAYSQSTCQRKSAGSMLLGIGYMRHTLDVDWDKLSSLVDEKLGKKEDGISRIDSTLTFSKVKYSDISVSCGYAYNWVFAKNFLFNASLSIGLAYNKSRSDTEHSRLDIHDFSFNNFNLDGIGRFGIVWNNTKWYAGASTVIHTYNYKKEQFSTNSSFGSLNIYVGVNFGRKRHH